MIIASSSSPSSISSPLLALMDEHVSAFKRFRREKAIAKKEAKRLIDEIIATRVIRFRLKDRHDSELRLWSGEVNFLHGKALGSDLRTTCL